MILESRKKTAFGPVYKTNIWVSQDEFVVYAGHRKPVFRIQFWY